MPNILTCILLTWKYRPALAFTSKKKPQKGWRLLLWRYPNLQKRGLFCTINKITFDDTSQWCELHRPVTSLNFQLPYLGSSFYYLYRHLGLFLLIFFFFFCFFNSVAQFGVDPVLNIIFLWVGLNSQPVLPGRKAF